MTYTVILALAFGPAYLAADVVLGYRPKPKTKPARRRKRQAAKNV